MKHLFAYIALSFAILIASCAKDEVSEFAGSAAVTFDARVGNEDFALNKDFTIDGRLYSFTQLRYWVTNVAFLTDKGDTVRVPNAYYLLEENVRFGSQGDAFIYPARKRETIDIHNIPVGNYSAIVFSIGVDSVYNKNMSLQAGELSQLNGMTNISWMWHTSYIFSSLKGTINQGLPKKEIIVETGLNNNYRTLVYNFSSPVRISTAKSTAINFTIDVAKIIEGVDLMATPVLGAGQPGVMTQVADNYKSKAITLQTASSR